MKENSYVLSRPKSFTSFIGLYTIIGVAELSSHLFPEQLSPLHYIAKPLIMLSLLGYFWLSGISPRDKSFYLVIGAICFSFLGDVFLIFEGELYFLLGLGSFLIAQIAYVLLFRTDKQHAVNTGSAKHRWFAIPIVLYAATLLMTLWPQLGDMQVPVMVYSAVIMFMGLAALDRYGAVNAKSYWKVLLGALLFILSDSLIAFSRFGQEILEIPKAGFFIMLTYIAAQFLIITGWMDAQEEIRN